MVVWFDCFFAFMTDNLSHCLELNNLSVLFLLLHAESVECPSRLDSLLAIQTLQLCIYQMDTEIQNYSLMVVMLMVSV